jgi:hypothetical protein
MTRWKTWLSTVAVAAVLAGAVLLPLSIAQDLTAHDHAEDALLAQLTPRDAAIVAAHQAAEEANPWHRVIVAGEALLIGGLGALVVVERLRGRRPATTA